MPVSGTEFFSKDPSVVVQLRSSGGLCLRSEFTAATSNTGTQFKAKLEVEQARR